MTSFTSTCRFRKTGEVSHTVSSIAVASFRNTKGPHLQIAIEGVGFLTLRPNQAAKLGREIETFVAGVSR